MIRYRRIWVTILIVSSMMVLLSSVTWALDLNRRKKSTAKKLYIPVTKKDRCPVCGMFVHPYQKWITQIQFNNGHHHSFDGMKCMSRFYLEPEKYNPIRKKKDFKRILVRDYYTLKFIPHDSAFYVVGSNVFGPMGHELIPFGNEKNARVFMRDHNGLKIFRFYQIDSLLLDTLDNAKKTVHLE